MLRLQRATGYLFPEITVEQIGKDQAFIRSALVAVAGKLP